MKKVLAGLIFLSFLVLPIFVGAAVPTMAENCNIRNSNTADIVYDGTNNCPGVGETASLSSAEAICCAFDTIYTVTDWIFWFTMGLVLLFVIIGALFIITAGGNAEKVTTGRKFIIYAAVGALVAVLAKAIPGIARAIMGV